MVKFVGKFKHTIDSKGRLMIPSKYRTIIGDSTLYILPGDAGNLTVYTEESFGALADRIEEKLEAADDLTPEDLADIRSWLADADYVIPDLQGRMLISQEHRKTASLKKDVVVNGVLDHFEIWDAERWEAQMGPDTDERLKKTVATMRRLRIRV